ncbi:DUF2855 family protein [Bradyrhizobium mercantei]|uniref:DUF2855 family protein n=1 Tax=Bradyrhizobium mercantei TaxID=1904807 RepID=UPI0009764F44|nr:DUF2855 family protein [Bradyrhizobium mercantei]
MDAETASAAGFSSFEVSKSDLRRWRWNDDGVPGASRLETNQVLIEISKFSLTSNNVTYARLGEATVKTTTIPYWRFFPTADGWGSIPVWGVGQVVASRNSRIRSGEKLYGFFPMATHLTMTPTVQDRARVVDDTPHRRELAAIYQDYVLIDREDRYHHMGTNAYVVLRPVFSLSFCCALYLLSERYFGAARIVISSASSKAALGLCHLLAKDRSSKIEIWGMTSAPNVEIVSERGRYDRVYSYDMIGDLPADRPTIFVDISGNQKLLAQVHHRLKSSLVYSCLAGFTHWNSVTNEQEMLPGPTPQLFSTPAHMVSLRSKLGVEGYWQRFTYEYGSFVEYVTPWLNIDRKFGKSAVERTYHEVLNGMVPPDVGNVLSISMSG